MQGASDSDADRGTAADGSEEGDDDLLPQDLLLGDLDITSQDISLKGDASVLCLRLLATSHARWSGTFYWPHLSTACIGPGSKGTADYLNQGWRCVQD